jgi:hypothetical protein
MSTGLLYVTSSGLTPFSRSAHGFLVFGPGTWAMLVGGLQVLPSSVLRRRRMRTSSQSLAPAGRLRASHHASTLPLAVTTMPGMW